MSKQEKYSIVLDEQTSWMRIGGGAVIGLFAGFFLILALYNLDDVEVPFILGAVVCTLGGPIYALLEYRKLISPFVFLKADKTGFRLNGGGPLETVEWQDVNAIELADVYGSERLYRDVLKITLAGDLGKTVRYNSGLFDEGEQILIAGHVVKGSNHTHVEALTALWERPKTPADQGRRAGELRKAPVVPGPSK